MKYENIQVGKTYTRHKDKLVIVFKDTRGILVQWSETDYREYMASTHFTVEVLKEYKEPVYKYFNMYKGQTGPMRNTKELAINNISPLVGYLGTYKIDIESGEITKVGEPFKN